VVGDVNLGGCFFGVPLKPVPPLIPWSPTLMLPAVISSANRAQSIFWQISAVSPPIRSWYVSLYVPGRPFR
jgi:hypothetical protein